MKLRSSALVLLGLTLAAVLFASSAAAAVYDASGPIASGPDPAPAINGPRVVGTTPGRPFLFLIPATGEGPLTFSAQGLPDGLALDPATGIIAGALETEGTFSVQLLVKGPKGEARGELLIVGGVGQLALTPPMGWNSWNVWGLAVDDAKVRAAADAMVDSGLAAVGFQYVNIDDGWEAGRDADGNVLANEKFPDMKALADYVHGKGLKIGIYTSPGPKTCGQYLGSYQHERQDAQTYAAWGIDYLKYDWCSYAFKTTGLRREDFQRPYRVMGEILRNDVDRDIVYSICQYGMAKVWTWGEQVGGNLWRTTGDITDTWKSMSRIGFGQAGHEAFSGPGHWNDPDMLVVGQVGWGPSLHQTRLSQDEQITHIALWSLLAAPLLIGCDMANLDQFTRDLLTNPEVIAIDQDPLGRQASRIVAKNRLEVWARPLADDATAVGLFNRSEQAAEIEVRWQDLGLDGPRSVRDLFRQKDIGEFEGTFSARVPPHGVLLIKIGD